MDLEELLKLVDIVDYISQFADLEEKNGEYWCCSMFKQENTPSFSIRRETGTWYDFSSGLAGNLYTFIRKYKKCSKQEAIEEIKQLAGVEGEILAPRQKMQATMCCKKYGKQIRKDRQSKPTVLPENYMQRYDTDYTKTKIWEEEGISRETLAHFQVKYDPFSNSIAYPIRDTSGNIANVGLRTLDPHYKEHGRPKYIYAKSWGEGGASVIYGLAENMDDIKRYREIILFEGAKSVMKAYTWGIRNCGALLTSHLSINQLKLLIKCGFSVSFFLDKEIDIKNDHNIQRLKQYVNVFYYYDYSDYLEDKDSPVDKGKEVFNILYSRKLRWK